MITRHILVAAGSVRDDPAQGKIFVSNRHSFAGLTAKGPAGTKALDPNATLTTGDQVGFWAGTAVWGASLIFASNPIVLGGAVIYGAAELGSRALNGKSIEQNIFDK